jgi:phosphoribosylamine--glycine ligase
LEDDLLPALASGAAGRFQTRRLGFRKEAAACVVLASSGYPGEPARGDVITGIDDARGQEGVQVFHAGTGVREGQLISAGGRVLNVCATGPRLKDALKRAYEAAAQIHWSNKVFRGDIGRRVVAQLAQADP